MTQFKIKDRVIINNKTSGLSLYILENEIKQPLPGTIGTIRDIYNNMYTIDFKIRGKYYGGVFNENDLQHTDFITKEEFQI